MDSLPERDELGTLQCGRPREGAEGILQSSYHPVGIAGFNAVGPVKGPKERLPGAIPLAIGCFNAVGPVKGPKALTQSRMPTQS